MFKLNKFRLASLHNLEAGQLIKRNVDDLATAIINLNTDPLIKSYVDKMNADAAQMDLALVKITAQQETKDLELLDIKRDRSVGVTRLQLRIYKNSDDAAEVAAYKTLAIPFKAYGKIEKLNFEEESNAIDNFVQELAKPVYASAIATLNLSGFITRMSNDNNAFKALFSTRSTNVAATVMYDAKTIRKNMINNYIAYCNYVTSLTNATSGLANYQYYLDIFNITNNIRKYYSDALARRTGTKDASTDSSAKK